MSGSLGAAFSVDEDSAKEATLAYFPLLSAVLTFRLCPWLREGFFVHFFCVKTHHIGTVRVCLAWSPHLSRYCCAVDCF